MFLMRLQPRSNVPLQAREMYKAKLEFEAKDGQQVVYHNHNAVYGAIDACFVNTDHHFTFAKDKFSLPWEMKQ